MRTINLRIGKKKGPFVRVPIQEPDSIQEFLSLHNGSEAYFVRAANRGRRIDIQAEARDLVAELTEEGKDEAAITAAVTAHLGGVDLTEKKERRPGRPRKPAEVKITAMPATLDELRALLEAQGLKVTA